MSVDTEVSNEEDVITEDSPIIDAEETDTSDETDLSEKATTTDILVPEAQEIGVVTVFNDQNKFRFSKDECISVGDGTYYCTDSDQSKVSVDQDGVFARADADGDREIFVKKAGTIIQITNNLTDDDAPYYDEKTDTIVWHRLVDGRYQIFEYDFATEEERQLTTERYNNMQPSRYGDIIVWQGWVGNDWEVMLEENGELIMVTDNDTHDISPRINGNYIIWQSFEDGAWKVKVYDLITGTTNTISDAEGGSVENPRFVLVYDTKFGNGDVETRGYDLESGQVVPLSQKGAPHRGSPQPTSLSHTRLAPSTTSPGDSLHPPPPAPLHIETTLSSGLNPFVTWKGSHGLSSSFSAKVTQL